MNEDYSRFEHTTMLPRVVNIQAFRLHLILNLLQHDFTMKLEATGSSSRECVLFEWVCLFLELRYYPLYLLCIVIC